MANFRMTLTHSHLNPETIALDELNIKKIVLN